MYMYVCMVHVFSLVFVPSSNLIGSQDGTVHVWSADTGERITVLDGGHPGPTHCVQFNPKLMMIATACTNMVRRREMRG